MLQSLTPPQTAWELLGQSRGDFFRNTWDHRPRHHRPPSLPTPAFATAEALLRDLASFALPADFVDLKGMLGYLDRQDYVDPDGFADLPRIRPLVLDQGHALVLRAVHTYLPWAHDLARHHEHTTNALVRSNLYLTAHRTRAYPLHWDTHGLIVLQLTGAKHWKLYSPRYPRPLPGHTHDVLPPQGLVGTAPDLEVCVRAGDVLYVPRGWAHEVHTETEWSAHVTFGFHLPTLHDLLEIASLDALGTLADQAALRAYADPSTLDVDALTQRFAHAIRGGLETLRDDLDARSTRPHPVTDEIQLTTDHFFLIREPWRDRVTVELGLPKQDVRSSFDLPARSEPLLRRLLARGAMSRSEARHLLDEDPEPVLRHLAREGLVTLQGVRP